MNRQLIIQVLQDTCREAPGEVQNIPTDEMIVSIPPRVAHSAVRLLTHTFDIKHLSAITGQETPDGVELLYHFWDGQGLTLRTAVPREAMRMPSITDLIPGAAFYEREVMEMLHVEFEGHPNPQQLFLPDDWPGQAPLLQGDYPDPGPSAATPSLDISAAERTMDGRIVIPIGPQHPALKEPIAFKIAVEGEQVVDSLMRLGYVHRGIERLAQQRNYVQNLYLVERVCGICSHIHATTYCQAVESLLEIEAPPRARYLRTLMCELERIHSHMLWLGALSENIGFTTIFMYAWRDREIVLDIMEEISGQRISHAMNVIGGVRGDISNDRVPATLESLTELESQLERFLGIIEHERSFRGRTRNVGHLSDEEIRDYCVVGPMARASGIDVDFRRDEAYAAYGDLELRVIKDYGGDIWARTLVRIQEAIESVHICRQVLVNLPEGTLAIRAPRRVPTGEVVVRTEAPRGELLYYIRSDGTDRPARLKIRTPTLTALITLPKQLQGINIADVPAVLGGMDLCIACADR